MNKHFKSVSFSSIKSESQGRTRAGICAVFGNVDHGGDITHKGAFTKTLSEGRKRFKHLWNHDASQPPIARIVDVYEVEKHELPPEVLEYAPEATGGLYVKREYFSNAFSDHILECIDAGVIDEMSYAYDVVKKDFTEIEGKQIRNLREVVLYDTSDVNYGMNPATVGTGLKGYPEGLPLGLIYSNFSAIAEQVKAGARNSESDLKLIELIHSTAVDLGAVCAGEKSAAETPEEAKTETNPPTTEAGAADEPSTPLNETWLDLQKARADLLNF